MNDLVAELERHLTLEDPETLVLAMVHVRWRVLVRTIFDKTGVRSRRDLVGKVFFAYYEPRVRDNEARVPAGRPVRGGPKPPG